MADVDSRTAACVTALHALLVQIKKLMAYTVFAVIGAAVAVYFTVKYFYDHPELMLPLLSISIFGKVTRKT